MKLRKNWGYILLVVAVFVLPIFIRSDYYLHVLVLCIINIILASSLRAIATSGQISLGHAGFMGIGAYTSALLSMKLGFPVYASMLLGGVAAMFLAAIVAYPITRVRTVYFAMLTMFMGIVIALVISQWRSLTDGTTGLINIPTLGNISIFRTDYRLQQQAAQPVFRPYLHVRRPAFSLWYRPFLRRDPF